MESFSSALDLLRKSCIEYEESLKKTLVYNAELKSAVEKMASALTGMKKLFKTPTKCGICHGRDQDTALECGHCMCNVCAIRAVRVARCHFCRRPVTESMKIYL